MNKDKWTIDNIEREILVQANIKKIFACGPSQMCEDFDKAFALLSTKHSMSKHMFEIL